MHKPTESDLLHHGGRSGRWGNLGLWGSEAGWAASDYFGACQALAEAVGRAAGLGPGERVLSVACGAGAELSLWAQGFGVAQVLGVEADRTQLALARRALDGASAITVLAGSGTALGDLALADGMFDRLLCVDAAYHLHPRSAFLQGAWRLLRPGGTLAFTDLVVAEAASLPARAVLSACARACGLAPGGLHGEAGLQQQLQDAGFEDVTLRRLDDAVLGGFARFVRAQGPRLGRAAHSAAWRRPVWTARAIGPCRAAGLGYALLVARKPSGTRLDSSTAAATA